MAIIRSGWIERILSRGSFPPFKDIDFEYSLIDLSREVDKDSFPLLHIDILVDNVAGHEMFSFMDGFSVYNPI